MTSATDRGTSVTDRPVAPKLHQWTRAEYGKMIAAGLFEGQRAELIEGQILDMSPIGSPHAFAVTILTRCS